MRGSTDNTRSKSNEVFYPSFEDSISRFKPVTLDSSTIDEKKVASEKLVARQQFKSSWKTDIDSKRWVEMDHLYKKQTDLIAAKGLKIKERQGMALNFITWAPWNATDVIHLKKTDQLVI